MYMKAKFCTEVLFSVCNIVYCLLNVLTFKNIYVCAHICTQEGEGTLQLM